MHEEVSGTGMLWALLIFFFTQLQFFQFCKKNENRLGLCPLPYDEVLEAIIKTVGQNNVGISKN